MTYQPDPQRYEQAEFRRCGGPVLEVEELKLHLHLDRKSVV